MNKLEAAKLVARIVVGAGTSSISNSIIRNNVQPSNIFETISVAAASVVIGSMASDATKAHTSTQIDKLAEFWQNNSKKTEDPTPTV